MSSTDSGQGCYVSGSTYQLVYCAQVNIESLEHIHMGHSDT